MEVHDYSAPPKIHKFTDVLFRTTLHTQYNFQVPLGVKNGKSISITNKQLSFLPYVLGHSLGAEYNAMLEENHRTLLECLEPVVISEPVFQFFDYESVSGTGHTYDNIFYLLYHYIINNRKSRLLVVNSSNAYYNATLKLIRKYFDVEFFYIDEEINYKFSEFECIQSYQNIFFLEVKEFINKNLIDPILKTIDIPIHKNIYKLKVYSPHNVTITPSLHGCNKPLNNALNLDIIEEDEKIFLINKCKEFTVNAGSTFFINICYYMKDFSDKKIIIIAPKHYHSFTDYFKINGDHILMNLPVNYSGNSVNNFYNKLAFRGEIIKLL